MTIKEFLKAKELFCVVQGKKLSEKIVAALGDCPLCGNKGVSKDELSEEWETLAATERYRLLVSSCKKDLPYIVVYCDVAECRCEDPETPVTLDQLHEFFDGFRLDEWESTSWTSNQPDFYSEKTVKVFPNGVVEFFRKEANEKPKHFMLIPQHIWDDCCN